MFSIAMAALIKALGADDEDVQKVYNKFLFLYGTEPVASDTDALIKKVRRAMELAN